MRVQCENCIYHSS